ENSTLYEEIIECRSLGAKSATHISNPFIVCICMRADFERGSARGPRTHCGEEPVSDSFWCQHGTQPQPGQAKEFSEGAEHDKPLHARMRSETCLWREISE